MRLAQLFTGPWLFGKISIVSSDQFSLLFYNMVLQELVCLGLERRLNKVEVEIGSQGRTRAFAAVGVSFLTLQAEAQGLSHWGSSHGTARHPPLLAAGRRQLMSLKLNVSVSV